jgi:hypothetical protein
VAQEERKVENRWTTRRYITDGTHGDSFCLWATVLQGDYELFLHTAPT